MYAATINDGRLVNRVALSHKHIFDAVQASLKRLGTYIDVFQIHRMDPDVPHEEIMKALNGVVEQGWVQYLGASSVPAWEFQMLQNVAERHGWHKFISMQYYYNLLYREEEREMIPICRVTGVGCIPACFRFTSVFNHPCDIHLLIHLKWSPIARGTLARPWDSATTPTLRSDHDATLKRLINRENEADKNIVAAVEAIAKARDLLMAVIATAWCLSKEGVNPIVGLNSIERIDEIVIAVKVELSKEEIQKLEASYVPKDVTGY
jgi:aryl-alcohol dehydrogenase-like predicted oxidoreductase